ncbi:MAG TPA: GNAT family N-acetyltransferase [Abditibacteriaceae bacterium]|jgi:GNAT superfamily N-acetyltransferase
MNDIFIRPATENDVPQILDFIQQLAEYEKLTHVVVATEELLRDTLFGPHPAAEVLLAFLSEEEMPVGFALFFTNYSTFLARPGLYLEDLFVAPQYRGRGAGKALLKALAQLAKERGYGRFEWSCLDWNEPSICFYKSMGAIMMDEWKIFRVTGEALDKLAQS